MHDLVVIFIFGIFLFTMRHLTVRKSIPVQFSILDSDLQGVCSWRAHENVKFHGHRRNVNALVPPKNELSRKQNTASVMHLLFSVNVNTFFQYRVDTIDNGTEMANNSVCIQTNYAISAMSNAMICPSVASLHLTNEN